MIPPIFYTPVIEIRLADSIDVFILPYSGSIVNKAIFYISFCILLNNEHIANDDRYNGEALSFSSANIFLPSAVSVNGGLQKCNAEITNHLYNLRIQIAEKPLTNLLCTAIIRKLFVAATEYGGIAQLGERLNGIQEVSGSIPLISTTES